MSTKRNYSSIVLVLSLVWPAAPVAQAGPQNLSSAYQSSSSLSRSVASVRMGLSAKARLDSLVSRVRDDSHSTVSVSASSNLNDLCTAALGLDKKGFKGLAEDMWRFAISKFPSDPLPYAGLLQQLGTSGEKEKFAEFLEISVKKFPLEKSFHLAYLYRLAELKRWDDSVIFAGRIASSKNEKSSVGLFEVSNLLGNGQAEKAVSFSKELIKNSDTALNRALLALSYLSAKEPMKAEAECRAALALDENNSMAALLLSQSLVKQEKIAAALECTKNFFISHPMDKSICGYYLSLLIRCRQSDDLFAPLLMMMTNQRIESRQAEVYFDELQDSDYVLDNARWNAVKNNVSQRKKAQYDSTISKEMIQLKEALSMIKTEYVRSVVREILLHVKNRAAGSLAYYELAKCYRQLGMNYTSKNFLMEAAAYSNSSRAYKELAGYAENCGDASMALECYGKLQKLESVEGDRTNQALVRRKNAVLSRSKSDPALSAKLNLKRRIYDLHVGDFVQERLSNEFIDKQIDSSIAAYLR